MTAKSTRSWVQHAHAIYASVCTDIYVLFSLCCYCCLLFDTGSGGGGDGDGGGGGDGCCGGDGDGGGDTIGSYGDMIIGSQIDRCDDYIERVTEVWMSE